MRTLHHEPTTSTIGAFAPTASQSTTSEDPMRREAGIVEGFLGVVSSAPDRPAVRTLTHGATYRDIERRAGGVAAALAALRPGPVVLLASNGPDLAAGALGILAAGRTVVPTDPMIGARGLAERIEALDAAAILTSDQPTIDLPTAAVGTPPSTTFLALSDIPTTPLAVRPVGTPTQPSEPSIAVLGVTSGSTGTPKRFGVGHGALLARIGRTDAGSQQPGEHFGMLLGATQSAVKGVLTTLLLGGTVSCFDARSATMDDIAAGFATHRITYLKLIPTFLRRVCQAVGPGQLLPSLRLLATGGEPLDWHDIAEIRRCLSSSCSVKQTYGATETGRIAARSIGPQEPVGTGTVPVGRPIPPAEVWIARPDGSPADPGEFGEIIVDAPTFRDGVVAEELPSGLGRYRTGDRGRFLPDGQLILAGRVDRRIKVGGLRIEPAQLERILRELEGIDEAVVLASPGQGDGTTIVAHLAGRPPDGALEDTLRRHVAGSLHPAAVPSHLVWHPDGLPTLPSGKIDTAALATDSPAADRPHH